MHSNETVWNVMDFFRNACLRFMTRTNNNNEIIIYRKTFNASSDD